MFIWQKTLVLQLDCPITTRESIGCVPSIKPLAFTVIKILLSGNNIYGIVILEENEYSVLLNNNETELIFTENFPLFFISTI